MNTREFTRRLNIDGRAVVRSYESLQSKFEAIKNEANATNSNAMNLKQWNKLGTHLDVLGSAVKDLKRSIEISNDTRYTRTYSNW